MILSARFVRRPRRRHVCDWCERGIDGPHLYLYGMADVGRRPSPLRYCLRCAAAHFSACREAAFPAALAAATEVECLQL